MKITERDLREYTRLVKKYGREPLEAARKKRPPKNRGPKGPRYARVDDLALLMAVHLKRQEGLRQREAIKKAAELFWQPPFKTAKNRFSKAQSLNPRGANKKQFIRRLNQRLHGRSLEKYETGHPAFIRYSRNRSL